MSWSFSIGLNARKFLHYNNVVDLHCQLLFKEEEAEKKASQCPSLRFGTRYKCIGQRNQSHGAARVTSDRFPFLHSNFIPSKKKTNELCEEFHYVAGNSIKSLLRGSFGSPGRPWRWPRWARAGPSLSSEPHLHRLLLLSYMRLIWEPKRGTYTSQSVIIITILIMPGSFLGAAGCPQISVNLPHPTCYRISKYHYMHLSLSYTFVFFNYFLDLLCL